MAGNPMGCTAALTTIDILQADGLVANARDRGRELMARLWEAAARRPFVRDVRGRGLLVGLELAAPGVPAKTVERRAVAACRDRGLLVYGSSGPNAVLIMHPPLTITSEHVDEAAALLDDALGSLE
jgi:4-aminobutyrate aminotransferase